MPAWRTVNLRVDNSLAFADLSVDMRADYVDFYNPTTGAVTTKTSGLTAPCAINAFCPGFRDQQAAFIGGDQIWFYYILNSVTGSISTVCSKRKPKQGGPDLSSSNFVGFDSWSPCFPCPLVTTATLLPMLPSSNTGGTTPIRVRNNRVHFKNAPVFEFPPLPVGHAYPSFWPIEIDMSAWIPTPDALTAMIQQDPEVHSIAPCQVGFIPGFADGNNYGNLSVYLEVAGATAAQNTMMDIPIDDDAHLRGIWSIISGIPTSYTSVFILHGYSFSNG